MPQSLTNNNGGGINDPTYPAPQYYDLSAPLTRPVTTLQVTGFAPREGTLPSLIVPDGSLYFGPIVEDGKYRIPNGCGIILFHNDSSVPSTFVKHASATTNNPNSSYFKSGGLVPHFFGRGFPRDVQVPETDGQRQRPVGQAAAAFTALCKRYQQGDRYGGDWANGVFHGEGILVSSYFTYQGEWKDGFMHGKGTIAYTRKYVDACPAAAGAGPSNNSGGVGTLLLKGLSHVTPFELLATGAVPKEYFGTFEGEHGRHGSGLMRYYNGDVYEGEWQNNCRHGKGKLRKLDGEIYEGEWANDERQGYGKIMLSDGSLFKGLMHHDQRNGEGIMRFANGDEYFGSFVADRIEGHGTMKYRNGDVYIGAWHNQMRHGNGTFTLKRTGATMTGIFQNGLIHGEATVVVPGVSTFVGTFVRGERTVGTMHWQQQQKAQTAEPDGNRDGAGADVSTAAHSPSPDAFLTTTTTTAGAAEAASVSSAINSVVSQSASSRGKAVSAGRKNYLCYQGEWHGEHMHGRGLLWYTNGDFYSGYFKKSLRHGPGNIRYAAEKAEFSGQFVYGVRHGQGLLQRADGSICAGRWQENLFVEGYEGEWDGATFNGIGRLTIPLDTFFGLRATNSTLKPADVSATLNEVSSPPLSVNALLAAAAEEEDGVYNNNGSTQWVEGVLHTNAAPGGIESDVLRRANLAPHFIDYFGLFRNGVRDGLGLLKLPALDCLVGGVLSSTYDRRGTGKVFLPNNSGSLTAMSSSTSNSGNAGGAADRRITSSASHTTLSSDANAATLSSSASAIPSVVIKGRWVHEVLHCEKGVVAFPNGLVYIGAFHNGAREASCARVWWPDGSVLESGWRDDAPSGPGLWYQRNRADPIFQTIIPSTLRRSRSRRLADAPSVEGTNAGATAENTQVVKARGNNGVRNSFAGGLFGLSYLWGLVGLGLGGGGSSDDDEAADESENDDDESNPRRVLIDFCNHFVVACTWHPYAMDLNTYARVVLPDVAAQTAPLANGMSWPLLMHSASMSTAMAIPYKWTSSSPLHNAFQNNSSNTDTSTMNTSIAVVQRQQQQPPTTRQIAAGAAALHLSEPPPKLSVGRANGPAVVYFHSGVILAGEWLSNMPRLAVPYRPWSAYDNFLVWQASRPAARNCMKTFPLWVPPRSQSCYSALLVVAPDDVLGEPQRTTPGVARRAAPMAFSPLSTGAPNSSSGTAAAAISESTSGVTSPDRRCTVCAKEYSFFRKRMHCTLCLRSSCSWCLNEMNVDAQHDEDVKAILQHAYVTSEKVMQLVTSKATTAETKTSMPTNGSTVDRTVFPSIPVEQVEHVFDTKNVSIVPVCAECVRAVLWKLRYTQLWIPTSIFASVVDTQRHQCDTQLLRKANKSGVDNLEEEKTGGNGEEAARLTAGVDSNLTSPFAPGEGIKNESSRQVSAVGELLPVSEVHQLDKDMNDAARTPTSPRQSQPSDNPLGDSPVPTPPAAIKATADSKRTTDTNTVSSKDHYRHTPHNLPRPSGELLPPTQYITYSGYTSHSIPHVYGELWWGRRYYYRGGFCAGERHGFGVQYMPNGERYEGAFQRDAWHGQGVYYLEDGSVLFGEFRRGELRVVQYRGEVEEDAVNGVRPHGRGIGYDPDGSIYNGEWMHGQRHGTGMLHFPDGVSVYSGTFVANAMEGMGKLLTMSGAYYGDFSQNQQQGKGLLFTSNCIVEGSWVHGASSGFTRIYETDTGEVYETTYRDGNERDDCFSAPVMVENSEAAACGQCGSAFSFFLRRHHCRLCGDVFCDACTQHRATLPANFAGNGATGVAAGGLNATTNPNTIGQRVCDACFYRLTQRRMIGLRRYRDGSIYAGCWSQGRWVSRGLYCRPDGIFIVMDTYGHPLIPADLTQAKMGGNWSGNPEISGTSTKSNGNNSARNSYGADEQGKRTSAGVPPGGFGVSRHPARAVLPISPSILQDAAPAKEVLDNVSIVKESSSRKDLDDFLVWWATTCSRCGLQVPLDVLLVSKYRCMPAQLLRGGKSATVTVGSDTATYLACPPRCTMTAPHTPLLTPIRLFVTLTDSRKAMQATVEGEVRECCISKIVADSKDTVANNASGVEGGQQHVDDGFRRTGEREEQASNTTAPSLTSTPPTTVPAASASVSSPTAAAPLRIVTEEQRTIDVDVEAAALRASRFMPVAIPRAPTVPITTATVPTISRTHAGTRSPLPSTSTFAQDFNRAVKQQRQQQPIDSASRSINSDGSNDNNAPVIDAAESGDFGFTAWATRPPPSIEEEDITDENLMAMMRAERLAWPSTATNEGKFAEVGSLMPPTPTPPQLGENTPISWDVWTTRDIPRYAPPPLVPVTPDNDTDTTSTSTSKPNTNNNRTSASSSASPRPPQQPRSEADLYFACPFWKPMVPDAQMLLEQGKMTQAARLMRRLQQEHSTSDVNAKTKKASSGGGGDTADSDDGDLGSAWGAGTTKLDSATGSLLSAPAELVKGEKSLGGPNTPDVPHQMQVSNGAGTGGLWTADGLLSAEQRAQSGSGWAPAPMHGPFVFDISATEKIRSADGQRWCFKVRQTEINNFQ